MGTFLVSGVLAAAVCLIIRSMVRDKRQGKSGCGGDCSKCRGCH